MTNAASNQLAMSVADFCTFHSISKPTFYVMIKRGFGPTIMKVGARTLISTEAAAEWRRKMEDGAELMKPRKPNSWTRHLKK